MGAAYETSPKTHIIPPTAAHTHTCIFLHGRDSTAAEFASEFFESETSDSLTLPVALPSIKWVLPSAAPLVSARFDTPITQWFGMWSTEDPHERSAEQDLTVSATWIQEMVHHEAGILGGRLDRIFLGGISRGCAIAVHVLLGMQGTERLAGFVGLSSWIVGQDLGLDGMQGKGVVGTPVLLEHCRDDEVIRLRFGRQLRDVLMDYGMRVEWNEYVDGGHWVNEPAGVDAMVAFVAAAM